MKINDVCVQGKHWHVRKKDFAPTGLLKTHLAQDSVQKGAICKEPTVCMKEILWLILKHLPEGQKSAGTFSRTVTLLIFTGFRYFAGAGGQHWWNITLT